MARSTRRQQVPVSAPRHVGVIMGDSLTSSDAFGINPYDSWPVKATASLAALGAAVTLRNFAVGGTTTTQILARVPLSLVFEQQYNSWPEIAVLFGGVNDPGSGISSATTQNNMATMARIYKAKAVGSVAGQAALPANLAPGTVYVVQADTSTTGGLASVVGGLAGTHAGIQSWSVVNGLAGEAGWARITTPAGGTAKVLMMTPHFLNWTAGGDVVGLSGSHSGQNGPYAAVDTAIKAAAAAEGVPVLDLYSFLQDRLIAGLDPVNSGVWHVSGTNQHLNPYGEWLIAQAVLGAMQTAGWLSDMRVP